MTSGFNANIMFAEDKDISYKMEEVGQLHYVNQDLYLYRVLPQSKSHTLKKRKISLLTKKKAKCEALKRRAKNCLEKNPAFKHLLKGFEFFKNEHFAFALNELKIFHEKFQLDQLPRIDSRPTRDNDVAVVVVTYGTKKEVVDCVNSILDQTSKSHEVIVINNGENDEVIPELISMPVLYIHSPINFFPSLSRNIGAAMTSARIVCFIDDNATVSKNYINCVEDTFQKYNIIGMRGRIVPKNPAKLIDCPEFYDPGLILTPSSFVIDGNTAVIRKVYNQLGGMDPLLFGGEGLDLSYRISQKYGRHAIAYSPDCVIRHDPPNNNKSDIETERYKLMHKYITLKYPKIWDYYKEFEKIDTANRYLT
jgi:GT2 family glycosyltransferase